MSRPPDSEGEPIENKSQLIEDLESGCKAKENWRIGTEHEKFPFRLSDNKRLPYEGPILDAFRSSDCRAAGLLIGPEGGFANEELDQVDKLGNVCRVSLGKRILRSDTAALAALACWQAAAGDWL